MSELLTVVLVAAGAQLAVLPGEKVQLIIASLSTRYHPAVVVAAAGTAFAGWTVLEILFGNAIQNRVPELYLEVLTIVLFVVFAGLLIRSMPDSGNNETQTDGGHTSALDGNDMQLFGREVPDAFGGFLPIFLLMATGEVGDKTQIVTITLAAEYGAHPGIWIGEMLVIIPVSLANAYFFHTFSHRFNVRKAHLAGASIFLFFAADTLLAVLTGFSLWEAVVGQAAEIINSLR